jgi:hypothetical protein
MDLCLAFNDIHTGPLDRWPAIKIIFNQDCVYHGPVKDLNIPVDSRANNILQIVFSNKTHADTLADHSGKIKSDLNFSLQSISVDGHDLKNLIWNSRYITDKNDHIPGCLFFGPPGYYEIEIPDPILPHILANHQSQYHRDWNEDYTHYEKACSILKTLLNR